MHVHRCSGWARYVDVPLVVTGAERASRTTSRTLVQLDRTADRASDSMGWCSGDETDGGDGENICDEGRELHGVIAEPMS